MTKSIPGRPTNDPKQATLNFRLPAKDRRALNALSTSTGLSVSNLAQTAIRQYLASVLPPDADQVYNPLTDLLTPALTRAVNHAQENHEHPTTGTPTHTDSDTGTAADSHP